MLLESGEVKIIAEIGSNHNGDLDTALNLIDAAAKCGADICKFQGFLVDDLLSVNDPHYEIMKRLEIPKSWYPLLMARCEERGLQFLSTATNFTTLEWMESFGVRAYKVASCNITHRPLLDRLILIGKPLMVSTGMARLEEIQDLTQHFRSSGFHAFVLLHCVARYPTRPAEARLKNISILRDALGCRVGFSDHTHSVTLAAAAVALGAVVIEKHISLDRTGIGLDHEVAVLPDAFAAMCAAVRETEQALFADFAPDINTMREMRRTLHFRREMKRGEIVREDDVKIVRPEDGLPPALLHEVAGRPLRVDVKGHQPVTSDLFEED